MVYVFEFHKNYTKHTHGLLKHETRPVWFSLVVDNFGIKYIGRDNTEQLMASIKKNYAISSDWTGSLRQAVHHHPKYHWINIILLKSS
jgi:hypothetical protein